MISDLSFIVLLFVIISLLVERYFLIEQHKAEKDKLLDELSKAIKAVISKNANEYVMTTSIDKVPSEPNPTPEPDLIPEETLSDEDFMKAINKDIANPSEK